MYKLRPVGTDDLDDIFDWRNHDDIRKHMYNYEIITRSEHVNWFEKMLVSPEMSYFILEKEKDKIGVLGFYDIDEKTCMASWAFYKSPYLNVRGIGVIMEYLALEYYFDYLSMRKLNCEVLEHNSSVIKMHEKFGFIVEGCKRKHFLNKNGDYEDIYLLSIFRSEWLNIKEKIENVLETKFGINGNQLEIIKP